MFWITKDLYFDHSTGESLQFYGVSLDGHIQLYGSDGFDTTTGDPLRKVTKQIIFAYEQQQAGLSPVAVSLADFQQRVYDGTTGATRVWYARHPDGHFGLYDRPGFDAILGVDLKPVTPEVANEIRGWIDRRTQADSQRAASAALRSNKRAAGGGGGAEAARLAFVERYIDRNSRRVAGMSNVAVRLIQSGDANRVRRQRDGPRAARRGFNVVPLFKPDFGARVSTGSCSTAAVLVARRSSPSTATAS